MQAYCSRELERSVRLADSTQMMGSGVISKTVRSYDSAKTARLEDSARADAVVIVMGVKNVYNVIKSKEKNFFITDLRLYGLRRLFGMVFAV